jgi:hypothetical protein
MTALSQTATRIFLMSLASIVMANQLFLLAAAQAQQKSGATHRNNPGRDLRKVGEAVAKAVLDKNMQALLTYDRADLRSADEASLKNPKSDLYCYIFDSDCITWGSGNWRSVYDKLSQAHQLETKLACRARPMIANCTEACFSMMLRQSPKKTCARRTFYARKVRQASRPGSSGLKMENGGP